MTTESIKNRCERTLVGGADCQHHIKKHNCGALTAECIGRKNGIGADLVLAEKLVGEQKYLIEQKLIADQCLAISIERLERNRSTECGHGHLSNPRVYSGHTSPAPFK